MIYKINNNKLQGEVKLALAIHKNGEHVGIIYTTADEKLNLLHHGSHLETPNEPLDETKYYCCPFEKINQTLLDAIGLWAEQFQETENIPYSIIYDESASYFDENNNYYKTAKGDGLTCCTFILAVFNLNTIRLANLSTWPNLSEEDRDKFNTLLQYFSDSSTATPDHILIQRQAINHIKRIAPIDISCIPYLFTGQPVEFPNIDSTKPAARSKLENLNIQNRNQ